MAADQERRDDRRDDRVVQEVTERADARREQQEQQNPSGHGMQVTPRQQQQIAEARIEIEINLKS